MTFCYFIRENLSMCFYLVIFKYCGKSPKNTAGKSRIFKIVKMCKSHDGIRLCIKELTSCFTFRSLFPCPFWSAEKTLVLTRSKARAYIFFPAKSFSIPALSPSGAGELSGSDPQAGPFWTEQDRGIRMGLRYGQY